MKLSELLEEFVDLKIQGCPESGNWQSIDWVADQRRNYYDRLAQLKTLIDQKNEESK